MKVTYSGRVHSKISGGKEVKAEVRNLLRYFPITL